MKQQIFLSLIILIIPFIGLSQIKKDSNTTALKQVSISSTIGGKSEVFKLIGSGHYLDREELQKLQQSDINRMLKQIPGVNIQEEDGFGLRPNIGLRGVGSERSSKITIMEDGILMSPAPYAAPSAYYFPLAARMQAIEILKGSSQIRFGPNTNGGVINLISTQIPDEFTGALKTSIGNFGNRSLHAYAGGKYKRIGFLVESFQAKTNGFKELPNGANTGFGIQDYLMKLSYESKSTSKHFQKIELKIAENTQLANETYLGITQEDFDKNPYQRYAASQLDNIDLKQRQYVLSHSIDISKQLQLQTSVYRTDFERNWYKLDKVYDTAGVSQSIGSIFSSNMTSYVDILKGNSMGELDIKANNRAYYSQGIQTMLSGNYTKGKGKHSFVVGARLHQDAMDRFQWQDRYFIYGGVLSLTKAGEAGTESNRIQMANAFSAYAQYQLEYGKLKVIPGIRYENIQFEKTDYGKADVERSGVNVKETTNDNQVILPGIGVSYAANNHWIFIGGAHKGFSPAGFTTNAQPENSLNYEAGFRYKKKSMNASVIGFFSNYQNLLGADNVSAGGTGTGELYNGGKARALGAEVMFSYNPLQNKTDKFALPIGINYTFTQAQFLSGFDSDFEGWGSVNVNDDLPYIPNHQLGATLSFVTEKFSFNYNYKWQSEMLAVAGVIGDASAIAIPSFSTSDVSAAYDVNERLQVFGNVLNVFNQKNIVAMRPAGLRPNLARNVNVGVKIKFK